MAFFPEEITRFQTMADEMAKLIEDKDHTSNNAAVAYSKIGRICVRALSQNAALDAARTTRATSVVKFQTARQARLKKPDAATSTASTSQGQPQAQKRA